MNIILLWIPFFLGSSSTSVNLFLDSAEVKTLLGLNREISYIRDGVINENAVRFTIPISERVDHLHFTWYTDRSERIYYSLRLETSDPLALRQPSVNVSHRGYVPTAPETWRVSLPCSGLASKDVLVTINVDLVGLKQPNANVTSLRFRRKKTCKAEPLTSEDLGLPQPPPFPPQSHQPPPPYMVFLGVVLGAIVVVVIIVIVVVVIHIRSKQIQRRHQNDDHQKQNQRLIDNNKAYQVPHIQQQQQQQQQNQHRLGCSSDAESRVTDWVQKQQRRQQNNPLGCPPRLPEDIMSALNVDRLRLKLGQLIQEGTFGRIYQGTLLVLNDEEEVEEDVIVKTVVSGSSTTQSQLLINEGTILTDLSPHRHVLSLIATTMDGTSPMLVYPYMSQGNLKKWLTSGLMALSTHQVVSLGLQLLSALQYLHKKRIIHKDVATRNAFLGDGMILRLCDSALSRDIFPSDYHCLGDNENRPVKWMPIEAIAHKKYSRASDVWSFGVFLWELMTRGQQPFSDIDPFEMEGYLQEGFRLHQPLNCPDQLYSLMSLCWSGRAADRATIHALHNNMQVFQRQLQRFV